MEKNNSKIVLRDKLIHNENFIVFGTDFARHPHALEHVLRPLFQSNNILWVDSVGLRSPGFTLYDLKRAFEKISKWFKKSKPVVGLTSENQQNVKVISPFMIPFNQFTIIRKFNKWTVEKKIKLYLLENKITNPILITCLPNACDVAGSFNERLKIYYCVDELSLWPGLNTKLIIKLEKKLIENIDLIIATSEHLSKSKKIKNKLTPIITHGVEFDHFNIGRQTKKNIKTKICCFGLFDERNDQGLIRNIAVSDNDYEIHIFGNIVCDISHLDSLSNIIFYGKINYAELPLAISEMDIFILPYVRSELTDNINPLKLKEYLSTGRPVIATALPEIVKLKDYLFIANNPDEFIAIIKKIQKNQNLYDSEKTIEYIKSKETWLAKSQILSEIILKNT